MIALWSTRVVLGEGSALRVVPAGVCCEGRWITRVIEGDRARFSAAVGGEVVDLGDRLLAPAFVNAHTHLAMVAFRGLVHAASLEGNVVEELYFRVEQSLLADDVRAFARVAATEALLCGTGCVWDHYYFADALIDGLSDAGIAAVVAPTLQDVDGPGTGQLEAQLDATLRLAADGGRAERGIVAALGPHATDTVSDALWGRVAELADDEGLPIHVHVAQSAEEVARSHDRHGMSPVARLDALGVLARGPSWLMVHALYASGPDLDRLDPARHALGWCPLAQAQFHFPARPDPWGARGLGFALGTDAGACNDSVDVQGELRAATAALGFAASFSPAWRRFHADGGREAAEALAEARRVAYAAHAPLLDPASVLASVWATPGRLHPGLPLGRVAPGALANLAVWDLDHPAFWPGDDPLRSLALGSVAGALDGLVIAGRWRARLGRVRDDLLDDAYRDAVREASVRLRHLRARAGI